MLPEVIQFWSKGSRLNSDHSDNLAGTFFRRYGFEKYHHKLLRKLTAVFCLVWPFFGLENAEEHCLSGHI